MNKALPGLAPSFFPRESVDKSATQIPTGWDAQEYKIARESYLHNRPHGGRVNGIPAEVVFGASTGEGRLTVQEIASIEDTVMRAAALLVHEIDQIEDYVLRYAAVKEKTLSGRPSSASDNGHCPGGEDKTTTLTMNTAQNAATSNTPIQPVASLQTLATKARLVFTDRTEDGLSWALPHDRKCPTYKSQELVECFLQSLIETRLILPQDDNNMAFLISWITSTLHEREALPMIAEDIANIFGAMQFMWPHKKSGHRRV